MMISKFFRITRRFSSRLQSSTYPSSENPDEIAHFSRLSRHWWNEDGEFALLHRMNPVRMHFIRDKLLEAARDDSDDPDEIERRSMLKGKQVLDVGCGGGLLSEVCKSFPSMFNMILHGTDLCSFGCTHPWCRRVGIQHQGRKASCQL
jgi:hypothetical protein